MQSICTRILAVGLLIASTEMGFAETVQISPNPTVSLATSQPLAANEVAIRNDFGQDVKVHIKPPGGEWTTLIVPRNSTQKFWCERCRDIFEIVTETGGKILRHQLKPGSRQSVLRLLHR